MVTGQSDGIRLVISPIAHCELLARLNHIKHITTRCKQSANTVNGRRSTHRRIRLTTDEPLPFARDTALLIGNIVWRITQPVLVIKTNTGYYRNIRINDIDGIKSPSQADLQNNGIKHLLLEVPERCQRTKFEIRQCDITARLFNRVEREA